MNARRRLLLSLLPLTITACGFRLRGETRLPSDFSPVYIDSDDLTAADRALLRSELERAGARVVDQPEAANRLWLRIDATEPRSIASSSPTAVSLWRIGLRIDFGLQDAEGRDRVPAQSLSEETSLELDSDNPLATRSRLEQAQWRLRQGLLRELVFRLVSR